MIQLFQIIVLIFSAIIHEYMHGFAAYRLGDNTAKNLGRLTLNPLPHIDLFGSIILPLLMIISNTGVVFGWAKPVPFNPYALKDQRWGAAKVAAAGPLGNLILALLFGLVIRFVPFLSEMMVAFLGLVVYINLLLLVFNLVPIPPLDGSKILASFLPPLWQEKFLSLERYGLFLVLIFAFMGYQLIVPIIDGLFSVITGYKLF